MLLLLASPGVRAPEELVHDVLMLDQRLPSVPELEEIVRDGFGAAEMKMPSDGDVARAVDARIGRSASRSEHVTTNWTVLFQVMEPILGNPMAL